MRYTIPARPTWYGGVLFRSRLEARWAAFFDLAGWQWQYEPGEFGGYNPDFLLLGETPVIVEVKPFAFLNEEDCYAIVPRLRKAAEAAGGNTEGLILGLGPHGLLGPDWDETRRLGMLGEPNEGGWHWDPAAMGVWNGRLGFCSGEQSFRDRISGAYSGGSCGDGEISAALMADRLWREAGQATRFEVAR